MPPLVSARDAKTLHSFSCRYSMPSSETSTLPRPSIVLMGVSGCGKTTVGALLAARLRVPFVDGDALHPQSNVAKMHAGVPLTDADRAPWLDRVGETLAQARGAGIVLARSTLKRAYCCAIPRPVPDALFVHLHAGRDVIARRLAARHGHFMPAARNRTTCSTPKPKGAEGHSSPGCLNARAFERVR